MQIFSSIQNPFDLYSSKFSFSILEDEYINWKTQPIDDLCLPATINKAQIFIKDALGTVPSFILYQDNNIVDTFLGVETDTLTLNGDVYVIYDFEVDLTSYDGKHYLVLDVGGLPTFLRSSDFEIVQLGYEMLKIEFTDSSETIKGGMFYKDGASYQRYINLLKYDNKVEVGDDEFATDFNGNRIDIEKTFSEIEYYTLPTLSKKQVMGLVEIAKNDTVSVNGRSASISFDISEINTVECIFKEYMTGSMTVTYSDSDGFYNPNIDENAGFFIAIDDDGTILTDDDGAVFLI